ncbi:MAG: site-2 protease family protein [Chlamydiia bacterium]|nr:site-2 protease family protein [Chlamydiia bacterium]
MTLFYFLLAAIALGILIFIHELGHYLAARLVGMKVEIFSIGFGKPLFKWRVGEVDWQLGWLPFGGYVKIKGMELSKKDREKGIEPYEIPEGFFMKAPWKRVCVAIAGPLSNFILAFLIFTFLWLMGGREKPFSEYTHIVGWVDPTSELYAQGLRPGDEIAKYNEKPFSGGKEHLYAAMLGGEEVKVSGYHINYITGNKLPFDYQIKSYLAPTAIDGIRTTGILSSASYLIYDRFPSGAENVFPEGSPMEGSGISYGDRLMWVDGELVFSMEQLRHLINSKQTLLTIERGDTVFLSRQPKVYPTDLILSSDVKAELSDWQYEEGIKKSTDELLVLPYNFDSEGTIEYRIRFVDEDSLREAFPLHSMNKTLEEPLKKGDKILAVDGMPVTSGHEILNLLQTKRVQMIVKGKVPLESKILWTKEDASFEQSFNLAAIERLSQGLGTVNQTTSYQNYRLLAPITPKRLADFTFSSETKEVLKEREILQRKQIEEMKDPNKRSQAMEVLKKSDHQYMLGIQLQDRLIHYNPTPFVLFFNSFGETWMTLKALVMGYLHPKWISGPVGIVQVIQHGWRVGIGEALFWIAAISLNLGFLNLLPIPVLDGGYIVLSLYEMLTRRRLKAKTMERIIIPFVVLLIGSLAFLTFQDISRFF